MALPRVLILAGGFGTRLASVVKDVPKPMAPIQGRPFLDYQIDFLEAQGFNRFTLLTGHLSSVIEAHFANRDDIDFSVETTPLGTGGAIRKAMELYDQDESFLVLNGDSFFACDLRRFCALAGSSRSEFVLALKYSSDLSRYGTVLTDADYRVEGFLEKSSAARDGFINAGCYFIRHEVLRKIPGGSFSLEKDVFEKMLLPFAAVPCGGKFVDIGTPDSLSWAQDHLPAWLSQKPRPCLFLDRDGVIVEHIHYLHKPDEVRLIPQVTELIRKAKLAGWWVSVVSNQSGVGRGLFSKAQCEETNHHIDKLLKEKGAAPDLWNCCYAHPKEGQGEHRFESLRRKPHPGMALETCEQLAVDLSRSLMIGDNGTDQLNLPDLKTFLIEGDFTFKTLKPSTEVFATFDALETRVTQFLT